MNRGRNTSNSLIVHVIILRRPLSEAEGIQNQAFARLLD